MTRFTRAAAAAALVCSLALPAGVATAAVPDKTTIGVPVAVATARAATLPAPTGPYAVGSTVLPLVDRSRTDPWVPTADGRELMVTLHYPAAHPGGGRPAAYATREETRLLAEQIGPEASGDLLARTRTHSRPDAWPAPGRYPLVLLSPGFGGSRWMLTHLAEDLASRGYVVASVDHAYESYGISVPGGRTLTCVACTAVGEGGVSGGVVTSTRAADMRYVLDRLTGPEPVWRHADAIDTRRVGMAGHSAGGASAATAMVADPRIDAGINMDGAFWDALPAEGLRGRPFLMLGTHDRMHLPGGIDPSWDRTWPTLDGWKRWITVAGTDHFSFTDAPVVTPGLGLPQPELPADRAVAITRTYVAAFFDQHLRGVPRPVLDGPTPENPEVHFQHR